MNIASSLMNNNSNLAPLSYLQRIPGASNNPIAGATSTTGAGPSSSAAAAQNAGQLSSTDFMDLLVAQLQNQDPTNPVDPTTFVTQLVQFNTLEQVIDINGDLTPTATTPGGSSATNPPAAQQIPGAAGSF